MNIKTTSKILFLLLTICLILNSCIFDTKSAYCIRNCTNDTLLIDMTETSNLDSCWMYWGKHSEDTTGIQPDDTIVVYIHGEKMIFVFGAHPRSYDSRYWGLINIYNVLGHAKPLFD